jgi:hypothetical protein
MSQPLLGHGTRRASDGAAEEEAKGGRVTFWQMFWMILAAYAVILAAFYFAVTVPLTRAMRKWGKNDRRRI